MFCPRARTAAPSFPLLSARPADCRRGRIHLFISVGVAVPWLFLLLFASFAASVPAEVAPLCTMPTAALMCALPVIRTRVRLGLTLPAAVPVRLREPYLLTPSILQPDFQVPAASSAARGGAAASERYDDAARRARLLLAAAVLSDAVVTPSLLVALSPQTNGDAHVCLAQQQRRPRQKVKRALCRRRAQVRAPCRRSFSLRSAGRPLTSLTLLTLAISPPMPNFPPFPSHGSGIAVQGRDGQGMPSAEDLRKQFFEQAKK